jgi:hypothetical protein
MKIFKLADDKNPKKAIVTRAKDDYELGPVTHPILRKYAARCNADFIVINEEVISLGSYPYEILQCYDLFESYERILAIDSDVLVTPSCPNLFDVVPSDCIGTIYEDRFSRKRDRRERIRLIQVKFGDIGWRKGYINTGVFLCSRIHRELFAYPSDKKVWLNPGHDDAFLGYRIHALNFRVFELPDEFNHMSMFSELGKNRLKAHMIHYAGRGFTGNKSRAQQIIDDLHTIEKFNGTLWINFCGFPNRVRLFAIGLLNLLRSFTI